MNGFGGEAVERNTVVGAWRLLFLCFGWEGRDEGRYREGRRGVYLWPLDVPEPVS